MQGRAGRPYSLCLPHMRCTLCAHARQQCGTAVRDGGVGRRCGTAVRGGGVGRQCGTAWIHRPAWFVLVCVDSVFQYLATEQAV